MSFLAVRSVRDISRTVWEELEHGLLFETPEWLAANESTLTGAPLITAEWDGPHLRSAIVWQLMDAHEPSPYYNIASLRARFSDESVQRPTGWTLNCVGVGPHSPALLAPGLNFTAERVQGHLSAAVATRSHEPAVCGFNFMPQRPARGLEVALSDLGFVELHGYSRAHLELAGDSYESYLAGLGSRKRWNAKRDRKRFAESGQKIVFANGINAMDEDLVRLQRDNKIKYGQDFDAEETRTRYTSLLESAGPDGLVARSVRGADCTGFAMFFRFEKTLHALSAGFEDSDDPTGPYFECLFHAPIEWAYEHAVTEIDYGVGAVSAKAGRGCTISEVSTWFHVRPPRPTNGVGHQS